MAAIQNPNRLEPYASGTVAHDVSENIRIARVVCIFFMMFTHVTGTWYLTGENYTATAFDQIRFFVMDTAGRSCVPLLSIISAYLACRLPRAKGFFHQALRKARSLLVPMVLWSLPFVGFALLREQAEPGSFLAEKGMAFEPLSILIWLSGVAADPPNEILGFLRDIFVLSMALPLLVFAVRRVPFISLAVAAAISLWDPDTIILFRPQILFFYVLGIVFAFDQDDIWRKVRRWTPYIIVSFFVFGLPISLWHTHISELASEYGIAKTSRLDYEFMYKLQTIHRILGVATFWILADYLRTTRVKAFFLRLEPFIFIAFCSHLIFFRVSWEFWRRFAGNGSGDFFAATLHPWYAGYWLIGPALALLAAVIGGLVMNAIAPPVLSVLNGGRKLSSNYPGLFRVRRSPAE